MLVLFKGDIVLSLYFGSRDHASVTINYLLSKTSQNIETDCSLSQNSNKRPFFSGFIVQPRSHAGQNSALLLTPSKDPLHSIQKCRQHLTCSLGPLYQFCTGRLKSSRKSHGNTIAPRL